MTVTVYVEGGGDSKELKVRCREGFSKLIKKAGFSGRMPGFQSCGGRGKTFDVFCTAVSATEKDDYPILLVDSEDPVESPPWDHLKRRDNWDRPSGVQEDQAQMMVTCMKTWVIADREALRQVFGVDLRMTALLPVENLEARDRDRVQKALEDATKNCGRAKAYRKGRRSFQVLAMLDPDTLKRRLPHFKRFVETLESRLVPRE